MLVFSMCHINAKDKFFFFWNKKNIDPTCFIVPDHRNLDTWKLRALSGEFHSQIGQFTCSLRKIIKLQKREVAECNTKLKSIVREMLARWITHPGISHGLIKHRDTVPFTAGCMYLVELLETGRFNQIYLMCLKYIESAQCF